MNEPTQFLADAVLRGLRGGDKVLLLVPGGSAVPVAAEAARIISLKVSPREASRLTVTLTDERYGEIGHPDSNWRGLIEAGFRIPGARMVPVLQSKDRTDTTANFDDFLRSAFSDCSFRIGLFGIGADGHMAGVLPASAAVNSSDFACGYEAPSFFRVTMTPRAILKLDEAIVFARGEEKGQVLRDLLSKDIDVKMQPAQVLKKLPKLAIFSDLSLG